MTVVWKLTTFGVFVIVYTCIMKIQTVQCPTFNLKPTHNYIHCPTFNLKPTHNYIHCKYVFRNDLNCVFLVINTGQVAECIVEPWSVPLCYRWTVVMVRQDRTDAGWDATSLWWPQGHRDWTCQAQGRYFTKLTRVFFYMAYLQGYHAYKFCLVNPHIENERCFFMRLCMGLNSQPSGIYACYAN